jgi:hypothetical protein
MNLVQLRLHQTSQKQRLKRALKVADPAGSMPAQKFFDVAESCGVLLSAETQPSLRGIFGDTFVYKDVV